MSYDIEISANCGECDEKNDIDDMYVLCSKCHSKLEERPSKEYLQDMLVDLSADDTEWANRDLYVGFNSEEEKTLFLRGVKKGYTDALFSLADYFGEIEFFEKLPLWAEYGKADLKLKKD